jgi:opine dehydrogenase
MKVAVVGTGVGGLAVAGHAGLQGLEVAVHDVREEAVGPVRERGGIEVRGKEKGSAPVVMASTDIGEVVEAADVVIVTTQGPEQGGAAASMASSLTPGQVVLVMPGCTFGAVEVRAVLEEHGAEGIGVAETDGFPYGCAVPEPAVSEITSVKKRFGVAVLPPEGREEIVGLVRRVFDTAEAAPSVLHTGLSNMNAILHVAPMVVNAGRVEDSSGFDFYGEGITPAVARVVQATDDERVAVARTLGIEVQTLRGWVRTTYGVEGDDLFEIIQTLHRDVYGPLAAPTSLQQRYLTEDVPCGAVPVSDLGRQLGVATPVTAACVTLADDLSGADWAQNGRTMRKVGLSGLSAREICARLVA